MIPYFILFLAIIFSNTDSLSMDYQVQAWGKWIDREGVGIYCNGDWFISGKVTLIKRLSSHIKPYELTPHQARTIFENKNIAKKIFNKENVLDIFLIDLI